MARFRAPRYAGAMLRHAILAVPLLMPACVLPGSSPWNDLHANAYGGYFPVTGDFSSAATSVTTGGGAVQFDGAVDLGKDESTAFLLGAPAGFAPIEFAVSSFGFDGSFDGQVTGGTVFNGTALGGPTNYAVDADIEVVANQLLLGFDIVNLPPGRVALLLGLDYLDFDRMGWTLAQPVGSLPAGTRQDLLVDEQVPLPVIGLRGDVWLPFDARLGGTLVGANITHQDVEYSMYDLDLALMWEPGLHVEVMLGYRMLETDLNGDIDGTTVDASLGFRGPYLGVSVYF